MNTQLNDLRRLLAEIDSLMGSVEVSGLIRDARSCAEKARSVAAKAIRLLQEQTTPTPQAWLDVQAERRRQNEAEGWTLEHDDKHDDGKIAEEAAGFLMNGQSPRKSAWCWKHKHPDSPTRASRRRQLVIGVALGLAEIERLDRAAVPAQGGE